MSSSVSSVLPAESGRFQLVEPVTQFGRHVGQIERRVDVRFGVARHQRAGPQPAEAVRREREPAVQRAIVQLFQVRLIAGLEHQRDRGHRRFDRLDVHRFAVIHHREGAFTALADILWGNYGDHRVENRRRIGRDGEQREVADGRFEAADAAGGHEHRAVEPQRVDEGVDGRECAPERQARLAVWSHGANRGLS